MLSRKRQGDQDDKREKGGNKLKRTLKDILSLRVKISLIY